MTCKWLIIMVIVSPRFLALWDPFQMVHKWDSLNGIPSSSVCRGKFWGNPSRPTAQHNGWTTHIPPCPKTPCLFDFFRRLQHQKCFAHLAFSREPHVGLVEGCHRTIGQGCQDMAHRLDGFGQFWTDVFGHRKTAGNRFLTRINHDDLNIFEEKVSLELWVTSNTILFFRDFLAGWEKISGRL